MNADNEEKLRLRAENERLRGRVETLTSRLESANAEIDHLTKTLEDGVKAINDSLSPDVSEVVTLRHTNEQLRRSIDGLKRQVEELKAEKHRSEKIARQALDLFPGEFWERYVKDPDTDERRKEDFLLASGPNRGILKALSIARQPACLMPLTRRCGTKSENKGPLRIGRTGGAVARQGAILPGRALALKGDTKCTCPYLTSLRS